MLIRKVVALLLLVSGFTSGVKADHLFPPESEMRVLPRLYDVVGVASDDVLNIRQLPGAGSPIVGTFAHDQKMIEVVATHGNDGWGLVNFNEGVGWVSMRFMKERSLGNGVFPAFLHCGGTEPFWSLEFKPDQTASADWFMLWTDTDQPSIYQSFWAAAPVNRSPSTLGFTLLDQSSGIRVDATGFVTTGLCNDGMSDRYYGLAVNMIIETPDRALVLGCCSLSNI